ncbi:MAG: helicase-related protein [Verrucomicrobiota bacterium]
MVLPRTGQRWMSRSEPGLGLGIVVEVEGRQVALVFPAVEEERRFALETAPLVRVRFKVGDEVESADGRKLTVERVEEDGEGLLSYFGGDEEVAEAELLDTLSFTSPEDRLLAGICDDHRVFDFRLRALEWNTRLKASGARGFAGARIDLIPHQFAIVAEAASRLTPRLLLADEVGLGKTIEACLILHHLHLTGRAERVLILVPEPLVHQWFVELYRRFNLLFALFDEGRAQAIEGSGASAGEADVFEELMGGEFGGGAVAPRSNPFLDSQLILASVEFLTESPERAKQAREAGFDLLVVDEAHHLDWQPEAVSPEYEMVEGLAKVVPSVLLLTATPQQLGPEGHFARLRLLDPARYESLEEFAAEAESYGPLAEVVEELKDGGLPSEVKMRPWLEGSERMRELWAVVSEGGHDRDGHATELVGELVDSFGTGRVLFRNTRDQLEGFPKRKLALKCLEKGESAYEWLAELLRGLGDEKVLLITHTLEAALKIQEKLLEILRVETAVFHEELSLMERDRQAAWFADPEGARILLCSEIGSEGRNFQFAHHLVLFDLPQNPEILEQRIGRLDRIGQEEDITIHVPYVKGSPYEILARWLAEGLEAFEKPLKGAAALAAELVPELKEFLAEPEKAGFEEFLRKSHERKERVAEELASGHDRLLVLGAPPAEKADHLLEAIEEADGDRQFESFALRLVDHLGLDVDDLAERNYHLKRGQRLSETFADLPEEGLAVTFDREEASFREDLTFLTADHPTFRTALEQMLAGDAGSATFAHHKTGQGKGVYLECGFILECPAPARLQVERFLPPTLIRVMVDHGGRDLTGESLFEEVPLKRADAHKLVTQEGFRVKIWPEMMKAAKKLAEGRKGEPLKAALAAAEEMVGGEWERLKDLATRNAQISEDEVGAMKTQLEEIREVLGESRLRLDCLRLVWRS